MPWLVIIRTLAGGLRKRLISESALFIMKKISQEEVIPGVSACGAHHEKNLKPGGL